MSESRKVVGDVVDHYLKIAPGKLGITFAVDVKSATEIAAGYRQAGVPAEVLTGKTKQSVRQNIIGQYTSGMIRQLVAVDIVSEGFDLPALQVGSMARPTASTQLFDQMVGRLLRPFPGDPKGKAILIDHVGNVMRHFGLAEHRWGQFTLEKQRVNKREINPFKECAGCMRPYERFLKTCPYCGYVSVPEPQSDPVQVDGDLVMLTPEALGKLLDRKSKIDRPLLEYQKELEASGCPRPGVIRNLRLHEENQAAQKVLQETMARYGGLMKSQGLDLRTAQKRFFCEFEIDVLTAQGLKAKEADALRNRIGECL